MKLDLSKQMNVQTSWKGWSQDTPKWKIHHSHKRGSGNADFCKGGKGVWNKNFVTPSQMAHLDGVAVDDGPVLLEVLGGEAALVDDLHLLHDRALPRLPRA